MAKEKKQLKELSDEDLKNVTGGVDLLFRGGVVEPTVKDLVDHVDHNAKNPDGTCQPGFVLNENGDCIIDLFS